MRFSRRPPGEEHAMRWQQRIRLEKGGVDLAADVNAAMTVNRSAPRLRTNVEAVSHTRVVQDRASWHRKAGGAEQIKSEGGPND